MTLLLPVVVGVVVEEEDEDDGVARHDDDGDEDLLAVVVVKALLERSVANAVPIGGTRTGMNANDPELENKSEAVASSRKAGPKKSRRFMVIWIAGCRRTKVSASTWPGRACLAAVSSVALITAARIRNSIFVVNEP